MEGEARKEGREDREPGCCEQQHPSPDLEPQQPYLFLQQCRPLDSGHGRSLWSEMSLSLLFLRSFNQLRRSGIETRKQ